MAIGHKGLTSFRGLHPALAAIPDWTASVPGRTASAVAALSFCGIASMCAAMDERSEPSGADDPQRAPAAPPREPALNVPGPLLALIATLIAFHAALHLGPFEWLHAAIVHASHPPSGATRRAGMKAPCTIAAWSHANGP